MQNKLSKIYITGDSFSWTPEDDLGETWIKLLAVKLGIPVTNISCPGVPQDWIWSEIANLSKEITSDDQLIVVLTDPSRFWYIESDPSLSNSWILESDFDRVVNSKEVKSAIEYYIKYIQRPNLDIQFLAHRLGWLNNFVRIKNLKKPLILLAFDQYIPDIENYPDLIFSKGNLNSVSKGEETPEDPHKWRGVDVRYNHLTLSNHKILADKIISTLENNNEIDLTTGFNTRVMNSSIIKDDDFIKRELSEKNVSIHNNVPDLKLTSLSRRLLNL